MIRHQSVLLWELLKRALEFRKNTTYLMRLPDSSEEVDITSTLETLADFCPSHVCMTNLFFSLCNASMENISPLTYLKEDNLRSIEFHPGHIVKLLDNNVVKFSLNSQDPDNVSRVFSFLRGC